MRRAVFLACLMTAVVAWAARPASGQAPPDYETFKKSVQPIFLDKKEGFARCYVCHSQGTPFRLQALSPGATAWDEEQSKKNFEAVQRLVKPGNPLQSRLLLMPLDEHAGGQPFHPGGKRWASQSDPEWQRLAAWVKGSNR